MRLHHRRPGTFVHTLFAGVLALLIALLFVLPERLLDPTVPLLAPAPAQAQTTTNCAAQTDVPQAECEALLALYTATNGQSWTRNNGWGQNDNYAVCSWEGITCTNGSVTELYLYNNELSGNIPPALGSLTNLQVLGLALNQLRGSIPPELGSLTNLTYLDLRGNALNGSIPPALGSLVNLKRLYLDFNELSGSIPPELGNLTQVAYLYLANNQLETNVTDAALLAWLDQQRQVCGGGTVFLGCFPTQDNWRDQRAPGTLAPTNCATQTDVPQAECEALLALYTATNGQSWRRNNGWGQNDNYAVCSWEGITCTDGSVTRLELSFNQLSGSIPPELGNLTNLQVLGLDLNQLSGSIPPELGNLTNVQSLSLAGNQLTGSIPPALGNLTNVQSLSLAGNQLRGNIPPELGNLTNLSVLDLSSDPWTGGISQNQLSGNIPPALGSLTKLEELNLANNQLTGSIPPELGSLTNLTHLWLSNNQLRGSIPPQLGSLTNLRELWLADNQLSGSIPPQLGSLTKLEELNLANNQLTDSIPPELGNLTNLTSLSLGGNQLSGSIPPELGNLTKLISLGLSDNQLSGNISAGLGNLTNLQVLRLSFNELSGSIPPQLGNLTQVAYLYLSNNQLDTNVTDATLLAWLNQNRLSTDNWRKQRAPGTPAPTNCAAQTDVPQAECEALLALYTATDGANWHNNDGWKRHYAVCDWGGVTCTDGRVTSLNLPSNQLRGSIPPQIGTLASLTSLYLNDNQLRGSIPPEMGNLTNLTHLWLSNNQLRGSIPPQLGSLTNLQVLWLSENQLSGSIPSELGSLTNLQVLRLSENQLSGSIPSELGSLTNLTSLSLGGNQLSGSIPPQLGSLTKLIGLYLSNNQLSGSIPPALGSLTNLRELWLADNQLSGSIPPQLANLTNVYVSQLFLANNQLDTNVTDPALLAWLNERDSDWRNQRVPSVQLSTVITGTVGGELVVPRDRRVGVRLTVPVGALPTEPVTMTYTGLPLLDTPLPNNQMMSGRFVLTATSTLSGSLAQTTRLLTLTVDLAPAAPQLAQTTPLSPVIYARSGAAWVPAETLCSTAGCQQQASDTQVTLLLDYVGEFAVGITPRRVYLPLVVRAQP